MIFFNGGGVKDVEDWGVVIEVEVDLERCSKVLKTISYVL